MTPLRLVLGLALLGAAEAQRVATQDAVPGDGLSCVDTHNQCLEWAWKGECSRNAAYMERACPLGCGACNRTTTTAVVGADGESVVEEEDLHGVLADPEKKWALGAVKNTFAAMERSDSNQEEGVSLDVVHAAPHRGPVDFFWMSDGSTRNADAGPGVKMFTLHPGEKRRLGSFVGHVFRFAATADVDATLTSFRVMPHRPLYELTDAAIDRYGDAEWCRDAHPSCVERAKRGECHTAPGWMVMKCSRSCEVCHLRDPSLRCARNKMNVKQTPGIRPGGVGALFSTLQETWPQFNVTIHSKPGGMPEWPEGDVADGPWVATLGGFVTEAEGKGIIGTVNNQFSRSTDQGAVDRYGEQAKVVSQSRTSENAWCTGGCESHPATKAVMARIQAVTGVPKENYESFQVLRYTKGQQYKAHHDMSRGDNALACGPRIYTFFLYLSDVEEGGETEFPLVKRPSGKTVKVRPTRGTALLWPSVKDADPTAQDPRTRHAALPVISGTKFAANAWIHMFDYEEPNIWGCTGAFD